MDFAAALGALRQNLAALGPRRLAILAGVGAFVFAAVGIGSYLISRSAFTPIYIGLTPQDSSRIGSALEGLGVAFDVTADGTQVSVAPAEVHRARALLAERGLPASGAAGYELFDKLGPLGLTTFMQEVTRVRALEGEIARTIQSMRGIRSARVHIAMSEPGALRRSTQPPSASVVVRFEDAEQARPVQAIRHLVAAAVPALTLENVRVLGADGTVLAAGGDDVLGGSTRMLELERVVSRQLQSNIAQTLTPHLGRDNFEASVSVRLNLDKRQTSENVFDPESKVERSVRVVKETGSAQNAAGRANTSVEQNIPGATDGGAAGPQSQKSNQRRDEVTNYEISSKATTTTSEGYRLENLTVAVVINRKRLADAAGQPLAAEALTQKIAEIERLVSAAAGLDQKRGDRVTVSALDFSADPAEANAAGGGIMAAVAQHSSSILTSLLVIVMTWLVVWLGLRPLARALSQSGPTPVAELAAAAPDALPGSQFATAEIPMLTGFDGTGAMESGGDGMQIAPTPSDRLDRLVGLDRERALAVLKRWISEERTQ